ncbi:serine/threonine-protein kinase [Paenibacillus sp. YAF4_2]|uniref:serine/threonine-protein kinase n=1 Tax=Paenibacillus sp. YAF4_2 TaxID=3233085 RepID=UPI003F98F2A5
MKIDGSWGSGTILGERYRVLSKLGSGGMGEVYAAEDIRLQGKLRAIKVAESVHAYEEARMLMRLSHPSLPHIIDSFTLDGQGKEAIVMDYIHGFTLGEVFNRQGKKLSFRDVLRMAIPLCSALVYLHRQSPPIIHRDIKPSNIMVEDNGHVRLIDFGIAKSRLAVQTQTTMKLGTPGFAAPEQHMGRSEMRTDIYGFGALLYYLLSEGSYINHAEFKRSSFLRQLQADVPGQFAEMLWRMVQPSVDDRYAVMSEVEKELLIYASYLPDGENFTNLMNLGKSFSYGRSRNHNRSLQIAVVSLSPGAGATFIAITLAKLLGARGLTCTAAEFPTERPEWAALLRSNMKGRDQREDKYYSWNDQGVWWYAQQHPILLAQRDEMDKLQLRQKGGEAEVIITDLSGGASPLHKEWMLQSDIVISVADPYPSRWRTEQLKELMQISSQLSANGGSMLWIANKDTKFAGRNEWMSMLPEYPIAAIPLLPATAWLDAMWRGQWATDWKGLCKQLEKAFLPLIEYAAKELQKKAVHVSFRH